MRLPDKAKTAIIVAVVLGILLYWPIKNRLASEDCFPQAPDLLEEIIRSDSWQYAGPLTFIPESRQVITEKEDIGGTPPKYLYTHIVSVDFMVEGSHKRYTAVGYVDLHPCYVSYRDIKPEPPYR